jgi:hypothetical protein
LERFNEVSTVSSTSLSPSLTNSPLRGEKTANILESNLTSLEKKIDDLLASFEDSERSLLPQDSSSAKKDDEGEKEKKEVDESKVEEQSNMDGNGELNSEGSKETSK